MIEINKNELTPRDISQDDPTSLLSNQHSMDPKSFLTFTKNLMF